MLPLLLSLTFVSSCYGQYDQQQYQPSPIQGGQYLSPRQQAAILMHKQALSQDGAFNYAFATDNGLKQGEVINPDGSRQGSYSYVDPNGKTVSLKYTAGKDGFRVLEGDHVPRPPPQIVPQQQYQQGNSQGNVPQQGYYQAQQRLQDIYPALQQNDNGLYQGGFNNRAPFIRAQPSTLYSRRPQYSVDEGNDERGQLFQQSQQVYRPGTVQSYRQDEDPYNKEPHSFGNGYSFEFGG